MSTMLSIAKTSASSRNCPVCESTARKPRPEYSQDHWRIVECAVCAMIYLENPPNQELLKTEQAWENSKVSERARRREGRALYYFFSDGLKRLRGVFRRMLRQPKEIRYIIAHAKGKRVLDVGCGAGNILAPLPADFVLYGIEPSPNMCATANALFSTRGGACIQDVAIDGFSRLAGVKYDFILMRSFLEHDSQAMATLKAAHAALSEEGGVLIKVPNIDCWNSKLRKTGWPGMRYPDHVNYFTPATLKKMVLTAGYSRVYMPLHWRLPTSDNLWAIAFR